MKELEDIVKEEISGKTAKSYVAQITRFHRVQSSTMFHEAAQYIQRAITELGFEANIEQFTSDGATKYWTWTPPLGWTVKSAQLRITQPAEKLLVRYKDTATCLHTYSQATPQEGVEVELVDVGEGTKPEHYEGKNVKGKFVIATGRAKRVHEQAVYEHGAAGVITDTLTHEMKHVRESVDIPDAHGYQSIWPTAKELKKVTFGFSLSKRQGNHLRNLLNKGEKVVLQANVDAKLFSGKLDVVSATIKGYRKPEEEVFLIAHLCHPRPSANDNASGSGLLLEIFRTISALIKQGRIQKPERTLRFLWVPETYGTVAYLHQHEELIPKLIAGINLDMVGQDQTLCKSTLNLDKTPDSNPSYLNDFIFHLMERSIEVFDPPTTFGSASTFRYSSTPFSGGSDHSEFNNSTFSIPCVMLIQWPDLYYHTSMDTIDKVSPNSLKRVRWITMVAAMTLANATLKDALLFASLSRRKGIERLQKASEKATCTLLGNKTVSTPPKNEGDVIDPSQFAVKNLESNLEHIIWRERKALESIRRLVENDEIQRILSEFGEDVGDAGKLELQRFNQLAVQAMASSDNNLKMAEESKTIQKAMGIVPKRLFKGTLSPEAFRRALSKVENQQYEEIAKKDRHFSKKTYEILNFMDGKRSVHQIWKAVSAEYGTTDLDLLLKYVSDLQRTGFISFR